jgi:carbon-monoxide dehydrogenase medium subunit
MKMPPFGYERATSVADLFDRWQRAGPEAKLIAGGQSLLATLAFRLSEPSVLIDISGLRDLAGVCETEGLLAIGALTRHADLGRDPLVRRHAPLLTEAVPLIAHAAIRNRGTLGGSLAFADPAAELPACAVALDAVMVLRSRTGDRRVPASAFFQGHFETALEPFELIAFVEVPKARATTRCAIEELTRRAGDYAMAGVTVVGDIGDDGVLHEARIVFFGVGSGPVTATAAMEQVEGLPLDRASIAAAVEALTEDLDPPADLHGPPALKRHLAGVVLRRALERMAAAPAEEAA